MEGAPPKSPAMPGSGRTLILPESTSGAGYQVRSPPRHRMDDSRLGFLPFRTWGWKCRLCGFGRHHRVAVPRSNGSRYETSFFACSGCSVMFLNDATFNAWHAITAEAEPAVIVTPVRRRQ